MAKKHEGKPAATVRRGKRKPKPITAEAKAAKARYQEERDDARRELCEDAALWVAQLTFRVNAMVDRLGAVHHAAGQPGALLAEVMDVDAVRRVLVHLEAAETSLSGLRARCVDSEAVGLPDLTRRADALERDLEDSLVVAVEAEKAAEKLGAGPHDEKG